MQVLKDREPNIEVQKIDETTLCNFMVNLTSLSVLSEKAVDKHLGSAHSYMAHLVLNRLNENVMDFYTPIYSQMLNRLEINDQMEELELDELLQLCNGILREGEDGGTPRDLKHVGRFENRLNILKESFREEVVLSRPGSSLSLDSVPVDSISMASQSTLMSPNRSRQQRTPRKMKALNRSVKKQLSLSSLTAGPSMPASTASAQKSKVLRRSIRFRQAIPRAAKANPRYVADVTIVEESFENSQNE